MSFESDYFRLNFALSKKFLSSISFFMKFELIGRANTVSLNIPVRVFYVVHGIIVSKQEYNDILSIKKYTIWYRSNYLTIRLLYFVLLVLLY